MRLTPALCVACGVCVDKRPEGAMAVELAPVPKPYETKTLFRDQPARCRLCGRELPYAESMARRVAQRLRESGLLSDHVYLCEDCRLKSSST